MANIDTRLIYNLDRNRTYHFVTLVLVVFAAALGFLASTMTEDARIAEFGSALGGRIAQFAIVAIGLGPLSAWLWWKRRYVRRIAWRPDSQTIIIECFGVFGSATRELPLAALLQTTAHEGHSKFPGAPQVNAPYRRLHIEGLPPLILDDQGSVPDHRALEAILAARPPPAPRSNPKRS